MQPGDANGGSPPPTQHDASASSARLLNGDAADPDLRQGRLRSADDVSEDASASGGPAARVASRSPHPYHRRRSALLEGSASRIKPDLASRSREEPLGTAFTTGAAVGGRAKREYARGENGTTATTSGRESDTSGIAGRGSPNESGTEADDESISYIKALPAPPLRPRKGLKAGMGAGLDGQDTPLLTPTAIDEEGARFEFPVVGKGRKNSAEKTEVDEELREARAKVVKRRRAELVRRASEVLLLGVIGMLVLGNEMVRSSIQPWHRVELLSHVFIISALYLLYPIRLIAYAWKRTKLWKPVQRMIRLPAAFDPAPLLYPQFVPVMISLMLLPTCPKTLLPNLVLGLSSVPGGLFRFGSWDVEPLRWLLATVPLIVSEHTDFPHKVFAIKPYALKLEPWERVGPEEIAALYPLHQSLVLLLQYLTTTSLLPAEVHLMSIGLINLLLCAEMPPAVILSTLLWLGGLGAYVLIGPVIRWNIALARVPRWRFRRVGRLIQMQQSFLGALNQALIRSRSAGAVRKVGESDADDDHEDDEPKRVKSSIISLEGMKSQFLGSIKTNLFSAGTGDETRSAVEMTAKVQDGEVLMEKRNGIVQESASRPRRNTLPSLGRTASNASINTADQRKRRAMTYGRTLFGRSFASLTQREATVRKWGYAVYTYAVMILLILGPIRNLIGKYALNGHEPFGWAISYLFGNIQQVRFFIWQRNLEWWVPQPPLADPDTDLRDPTTAGRAEFLRQVIIQEANTRLLLCAYCLAIIATGLGTVLTFTFVEVDTRRKVFHGMMVAMLLPTIYVDPAFLSLALVIILAIFLILDLLRASQLPPLSRPIARFLTPYVDGRDLRGPVVVSHIFLLVGCAVPLWLSLAGAVFEGEEPWRNWEVAGRDVSMISGVVCVGMGDAAASLIGRRYGRRKWPWTGGKSLEGSAAFAVAVTVGLVVGKMWLRAGQWPETPSSSSPVGVQSGTSSWSFAEWIGTISKAGIAACGASFMEAVLTGGNDNVVVPVVLWILVKALEV